MLNVGLIYMVYFFQAFSQHMFLSVLFLEHVISVLSQIPILKGDADRVEDSQDNEDSKLQAAIFALTAFFRSVLSVYFNLTLVSDPTIL